MNFGEALQLLQQGECLQRQGWNGKGMFIFWKGTEISTVDSTTDLPEAAIDALKANYAHCVKTPYLSMFAADKTIVTGWLASQTDMLADDWQIYQAPA